MSQDIIGSNSNVTCSYQPHTANGEDVWSERRGGAGTNSCQICPASNAGLGVALAHAPDDHPKVTLRFRRRQMAQRHHRKMDLITLTRRITGSFAVRCLEMFNCTMPTSKYLRNFNKEGRNKKNQINLKWFVCFGWARRAVFFGFSLLCVWVSVWDGKGGLRVGVCVY